MKKLAFGALMIGLLAACGDDGGPSLVDAGGDQPDAEDVPDACNPVTQMGCATGEKCTWQDVTADLGRIACVPDGTVANGGACTFMEPGENAGYDNCVAGQYCLSGTCQEICTDAPDSCPSATSACSSYSGLFEGADVSTGVCDFKCEPGTQARLSDDAALCGGTTERPRGCYGWAWGTAPLEYTCTPDISDRQHGQTPDPLNSQDMPYLNSCDAGYFPWVGSFDDTAPDVCIAFCTPDQGGVHSGDTGGADGVAPFTCGTRGAVAANSMECRFLHIFDSTEPLDQYNASGVCFDTVAYVSDWDGDTATADTSMPRCVNLTTALIDTNNPPDGTPDTPENQYWGCAPWPAAAAPGTKIGGFREMLEEKLRARLQRQAKPVAAH